MPKTKTMSAWTTERPTKAGWYWFAEFDSEPTIVLVRQPDGFAPFDKIFARFINGRRNTVSTCHGKWQPVQGPVE